jgi:hypothetical protein
MAEKTELRRRLNEAEEEINEYGVQYRDLKAREKAAQDKGKEISEKIVTNLPPPFFFA